MANEVIITECGYPITRNQQGNANVLGRRITTQVLNIATASAEFNSGTQMIHLQSKGTGFWYAQGGSSVSAAANTAGSSWLPADQSIILPVDGDTKYLDTAS